MKNLKLSFQLGLALLGAVTLLAAADQPAGDTGGADGKASLASPDYVLKAGDTVSIRILGETEMNQSMESLKISQDNKIYLPYINEVDLKDKTVQEASTIITTAYKPDYLVDPQVTIRVTAYKSRTIFVTGHVKSAGELNFPQEEGMTLTQAIGKAGGVDPLGDEKRVQLIRTLPEGKKETHIINVKELKNNPSAKPKDDQRDWKLQPGDEVHVPEVWA